MMSRPPEAGNDLVVPAADPELEARATDRLTLFSDAVVAIAITLLAIDLPVPRGATVHALATSGRDNKDYYAAFLISFFSIAASWSSHHDIFRSTRRVNSRLRRLNMYWLLTIVLTPFATKLLTAPGNQTKNANALEFGFYAFLQVVQSGLLLAMLRYMTTRDLADGPQPAQVAAAARQSYSLMAGFGVSIPVFFVTGYAWVLWFAVPAVAGGWLQFRRRRRNSQRPDPEPG